MIHTDGAATIANYGTPLPAPNPGLLPDERSALIEGAAADLAEAHGISTADALDRLRRAGL